MLGIRRSAATPSQATGSLIVQVYASLAQAGYKASLVSVLASVQTYLGLNTVYGNLAACNALNSFKLLTQTYSTIPGSGITAALAASWIAQADLIRAAIPC